MEEPTFEELKIAKVCHEANAALCAAFGDMSQPAWKDAPGWQYASALLGVRMHIDNPDAGTDDSHKSWMKQKVDDGWVYGDEKDAVLKTHPCIVPYDELPPMQQAKDFIFRAIVHAMAR